jgi:hypothetical protein
MDLTDRLVWGEYEEPRRRNRVMRNRVALSYFYKEVGGPYYSKGAAEPTLKIVGNGPNLPH